MSYAESVTCTGVKNGWARVENAGGAGYCDAESLTATNPNKYSGTAYAQEDGTRIYSKAATDSSYAELSQNTGVTVVAVTGDSKWCRVKYSDQYGYMKKSALGLNAVSASPSNQSVTVYVTDLTLAVYTSASTSGSKRTLGFGEKLTCVAVSGGWAKVKSGDNTGYCDADGLSADNPNTLNLTVYPQSSDVKVYQYPATSSGVLATVGTDTSLSCVARTAGDKWYRVKGSGAYGYVRAGDVDTAQTPSSGSSSGSSSGTSSKVSAVLKLAAEQLGDAYVYQEEGPDSFDCAGFVYYCFKSAAGVTLTRSAQSQGYDSSYEKIDSISDLQKGDMVCFDTNEGDSDLSDHTGIYLGDGRFIHASSVAGKVMISSLDSGYYKDAFSWGRRILN